jgi:hypothetical protein
MRKRVTDLRISISHSKSRKPDLGTSTNTAKKPDSKNQRKNDVITFKETTIKMIADYSTETTKTKNLIFKVLK